KFSVYCTSQRLRSRLYSPRRASNMCRARSPSKACSRQPKALSSKSISRIPLVVLQRVERKRIFAALPPRFSGCCQLAARGPAEALTQRAGQSFVAQLRENADLIERSSHHVREMQVARAEQTQDLLIIERMERIQADGV